MAWQWEPDAYHWEPEPEPAWIGVLSGAAACWVSRPTAFRWTPALLEDCPLRAEDEQAVTYREQSFDDVCQPDGCGDLYGEQCPVCGSWYDRGGYLMSEVPEAL